MPAKKPELPGSPEERRQLLDSLSARHDQLDKAEIKVYDALAAQVAEDEDELHEGDTGGSPV